MTIDIDEIDFTEFDGEPYLRCEHDNTHVTRYTQSNGVQIARVQCKNCGTALGNKKKADYDFDNLPVFDKQLGDAWHEQCKKVREAYWRSVKMRKEEDRAEWWRDYDRYLHSPEWRRVQQAVLQRDNHICQACLRNKATHVHHLSYELYNQVGRSAAFELVAVCRPCHEQIHPHMSEMQDMLTYHSPHLEMAGKALAEEWGL